MSVSQSAQGTILTNDGQRHIPVLPFDRALGHSAEGLQAVLYADPLSSSFSAYHKSLSQAARNGELTYRLRYRRHDGAESRPLPVSGYGMELALKRTDYIVIDDREAEADQKSADSQRVTLNEDEEVNEMIKGLELAVVSSHLPSYLRGPKD